MTVKALSHPRKVAECVVVGSQYSGEYVAWRSALRCCNVWKGCQNYKSEPNEPDISQGTRSGA